MTNEEFDRKAEFLLKQQAQFDADMRRLEAAQAKTEKTIARIADTISRESAVMFEGFKILSDAQKLTDEQVRKLATKVDRLTGEGQHGLQT